MQRTLTYLLLTLALALALPSCGRVKPQGAANHPQPDSTAQALMLLNLTLADEADHLLADSVRTSGLPYVLDLTNVWYCPLHKTDGAEVKTDMRVEYSAVIRDLATSALIEEVTEETRVGGRTVLRAIDICLPMMHVGDTMSVLSPYYHAYGRDGQNGVPPLTNVRILLTVNHIIDL